jgi:hypothetical protein
MQLRSVGLWISFGVGFLSLHAPAQSALLDKFDPADLSKPEVCPDYYNYKKDSGECMADTNKINVLKEDDCKGPGLKLNVGGSPPVCVVDNKKKPSPKCKSLPGYTSKITGTGVNAACSFERLILASAPGDYIGDCFHIKAVPPGTELEHGEYYFVSGQKTTASNDRELTLVSGEVRWIPPTGCHATGGPQHQVFASQLIEAGASRYGYAYGILTMPYKYFPSEKSFQVNVPIGGYLGYRYGQAGSGTTFALAVTLSSVKANTVDPTKLDAAGKPTVTGTADVTAISGAIGFMFDFLKSPNGSPFKAGVFIGKDIVSSDPNIDYRFNRKTWIAIQLGYDFTNN